MIAEESLVELSKGYLESHPFKHIVIDNFLKPECLDKILDEIKMLDSKDAYYKATHKPNNLEYNKFAFNTNVGPAISELFKELVSDKFVKSIETLTNIKNIIRNDTSLKGAGVHRIHKDGYLAIHTDFNTYDSPEYGKLDRRINILIYFNPKWEESYKGHLWLCDKLTANKVLPILNRCVIFNTSNKSIHGHPIPLSVPNNMARQSIAVYYYTKNETGDLDFEGDKEHCTLWYSTAVNMTGVT